MTILSKVMTSEVEQRTMLVMAGYGQQRCQCVNLPKDEDKLFLNPLNASDVYILPKIQCMSLRYMYIIYVIELQPRVD